MPAEWGFSWVLWSGCGTSWGARRRGGRVLLPEQVASPMDRNPTLEVAAAMIADCDQQAQRRLLGQSRPAPDPTGRSTA